MEVEFLHEQEEDGEHHANSKDDQGGEGVLKAHGHYVLCCACCNGLHSMYFPIQQTTLHDACEPRREEEGKESAFYPQSKQLLTGFSFEISGGGR